jgi:hypothetical protein
MQLMFMFIHHEQVREKLVDFRLESLSQSGRKDFSSTLSHCVHFAKVTRAWCHSVQTVVGRSTTVCRLRTRLQESGGEWLPREFLRRFPKLLVAMGSHSPPDTHVGLDLRKKKTMMDYDNFFLEIPVVAVIVQCVVT